MGIGNVTSRNNMSDMYTAAAAFTEPGIKSIQNKITNTQQQIQKLSSNKELSLSEKTDQRKKLQKEVFSLNTKLERQQEEFRRSQKREIMMAKLKENMEPNKKDASEEKIQTKEASSDEAGKKNLPADRKQTEPPGTVLFQNSDGAVIFKEQIPEKNRGIDPEKESENEAGKENVSETETKPKDSDTAEDIGLSGREAHAIVSTASSIQQADRQGIVIARTRDGIVVLKGEINQDNIREIDTERKQDELEKMEKREQLAAAFQFSVLGEANNTMKSALEAKTGGMKNMPQESANQNAFLHALKTSQANGQTEQQNFYVSFH